MLKLIRKFPWESDSAGLLSPPLPRCDEPMKIAIWVLIILLIVLHHDFWFWNDSTLLGGFLPVGVAYHIGVSLAASLLWYLATIYAWPKDVIVESETKSE